ncbi:MAG: hypothetical protein AAF770_03855 [Bacteroidota bacterium]
MKKRRLDAYYKLIYCDALSTYLASANSDSKEAIHIIDDVKDDNIQEHYCY